MKDILHELLVSSKIQRQIGDYALYIWRCNGKGKNHGFRMSLYVDGRGVTKYIPNSRLHRPSERLTFDAIQLAKALNTGVAPNKQVRFFRE